MRIAIIDKEKCAPNVSNYACMNICPRNRAGDKCIYKGEDTKVIIDEDICIGCGLCVKKCPKNAIMIVNTPEKLGEKPMHRFGQNGFTLFRLPFPIKGEVVGLLGSNGTGKSTALKILSGEIKPNLGTGNEAEERDLVNIFRGTELQSYLEKLKEGVKVVVKPQKIDILSEVKGNVSDLLEKYNERGAKDEVVKKLSLTHVLDRELNQLSGGELQRVAIAVAAMREADFYFFDEPSSYLDVYQRMEAGKLIRELAKDAAVMVVEHDLALLDFLADRIHILYGAPGAYGIVSKPYGTRIGINTFLEGYVKEDNVRFRPEKLEFRVSKGDVGTGNEVYFTWEGLKKKFEGFKINVGDGKIFNGEILGIFGSNALGKTTFAKMLSGEIKADSGKVSKELVISYKPQYISSNFTGTVIDLFGQLIDNPHSEDFRGSILRPLGIERLLENKVSSLSGGELQRVSIAICLAKDADLYLLDEPSAYLDVEQRLAAAKTIQKICERKEKSAMIIDHDLLFLHYLSDRAMLFSGKPSIDGSAEQFELEEGFNKFLKNVNITFRADPQTKRPRANKPDSQKDVEQKKNNKYFLS